MLLFALKASEEGISAVCPLLAHMTFLTHYTMEKLREEWMISEITGEMMRKQCLTKEGGTGPRMQVEEVIVAESSRRVQAYTQTCVFFTCIVYISSIYLVSGSVSMWSVYFGWL